jgi:ferrous iron transport protein A
VTTLPLAFLSPGKDAMVTGVRAGHGMHHRLAAMGIFPGSKVSVICTDRGSLIVAVGETRYALSHGMAMKILVGEGAGQNRPANSDDPRTFPGSCKAVCGCLRQHGCRHLCDHKEVP